MTFPRGWRCGSVQAGRHQLHLFTVVLGLRPEFHVCVWHVGSPHQTARMQDTLIGARPVHCMSLRLAPRLLHPPLRPAVRDCTHFCRTPLRSYFAPRSPTCAATTCCQLCTALSRSSLTCPPRLRPQCCMAHVTPCHPSCKRPCHGQTAMGGLLPVFVNCCTVRAAPPSSVVGHRLAQPQRGPQPSWGPASLQLCR